MANHSEASGLEKDTIEDLRPNTTSKSPGPQQHLSQISSTIDDKEPAEKGPASNGNAELTISQSPNNGEPDPSAEPPSEQPVERVALAGQDYSVLTVTEKKLVVLTASLAAFFSPTATAIYCESARPSALTIPQTHVFRPITHYYRKGSTCVGHSDQHNSHSLPGTCAVQEISRVSCLM